MKPGCNCAADVKLLELKLDVCQQLYAAEHCQFMNCEQGKECFDCIEKRYKQMMNAAKEDSGNIGITD